ncbi:MAG: hypothetical protein ACYDEX_12445 [Mobilitalea sp.]
MSLLSSLFNRKRQRMYSNNTQEEKAYLETEEEDTEEETASDIDEEGLDELLSDDSDAEVNYEVVEREIHPAKIICPDCGGITLEGLDFCDKCGGEL